MSFEHLALFLIWLNFMLYNLIFNMLYWIIGFQNSWKTNNWLSNQHKPTVSIWKLALPSTRKFRCLGVNSASLKNVSQISTCSVLYLAKLIYFPHSTYKEVHPPSSKTINELFFICKNVHILLYEKNRIKILQTEGNEDHIHSSSAQL